TGWDVFVLLAVLAFLVVRTDAFIGPSTPRYVILILVGLPGLGLLAARAARLDAFAVAGRGVAASLTPAALLSPGAPASLKGEWGMPTSVLIYVLVLGWVGAGAELSRAGVVVLKWALVAGALTNGLIGLIQVVLSIESGPLATFPGRAS